MNTVTLTRENVKLAEEDVLLHKFKRCQISCECDTVDISTAGPLLIFRSYLLWGIKIRCILNSGVLVKWPEIR